MFFQTLGRGKLKKTVTNLATIRGEEFYAQEKILELFDKSSSCQKQKLISLKWDCSVSKKAKILFPDVVHSREKETQ